MRNFRLSLTVHSAGVGPLNPYNVSRCYRGFALLFRVKSRAESWNTPQTTMYQLGFETRDCAGWSKRGKWTLVRVAGHWFTGRGFSSRRGRGRVRVLLSGQSDAIRDGENRIVVEGVGHSFRVRVNGASLFRFVDTVRGPLPDDRPIDFGGFGVQWGWESTGWVDRICYKPISTFDSP